jgi:dihydrolipoamide dehydrogenase
MSRRVEVAIIGAGTAGLSALSVVRRRTGNFVLVNDGAYGTTCARVGCMPSKALIEVAKAVHGQRFFEAAGVKGETEVDLVAVLRHVRRIRDTLVRGVLKLTEDLGERNVVGRAKFVAPDALEVNGERIEAERIIIATGSRPIVPAAWRALGERLLTTDELFEQRSLPPRIAVIGMGAVGAEIAQALVRLGLEVTGFDAAETVAGVSDPQVSEAAVALLRAELPLHLGAPAEPTAAEAQIRVSAGGASVEVDAVLVALGRRPNLDGLALERLGVTLDARGQPPFDAQTMRIAELPVYIAGDASTHAAIMHEAADEGWIAGYNSDPAHDECFERRTRLGIVFTDPEIALVGGGYRALAPQEAVVGEANLAGQGRLRMSGRDRGLIHVYAERESGRIMGAELIAPDGEHLAHLLALAVQQRMTLADLLRLPFYHPTIEEALRTALRDAAKKLGGTARPDLAACDRHGADALD